MPRFPGQPDSASPSAGGFPEAAYLSVASKRLVAVTGSSEAAGEIAETGPPEAARGTSRSVAPPVPLSWQDQVRKAEEELLGEATEGPQNICLLYTSPSPRDRQKSRMPSSA